MSWKWTAFAIAVFVAIYLTVLVFDLVDLPLASQALLFGTTGIVVGNYIEPLLHLSLRFAFHFVTVIVVVALVNAADWLLWPMAVGTAVVMLRVVRLV